MDINKNDFIEIEFTGRIKEGEIFDSNIKEDLEKTKINPKAQEQQAKTFIFSIGQNMFLKGIDEFLIGKEFKPGIEYEIEIEPEKAFGIRNSNFIKIIPTKIFIEKQINPVPGAMFSFDGQIAKIISVSGGRVITDFNNPLAGKVVVYKIKILREVDNIDEKIKSLMDFFFRREFKHEIDAKNKKLIIEAEKGFKQFIEIFKNKFKEILDLELEVAEIEEKNGKEEK